MSEDKTEEQGIHSFALPHEKEKPEVEIDDIRYPIDAEVGKLLDRLGKENGILKDVVSGYGDNPDGFNLEVLSKVYDLKQILKEYMRICNAMAEKFRGSSKTERLSSLLSGLNSQAQELLDEGENYGQETGKTENECRN